MNIVLTKTSAEAQTLLTPALYQELQLYGNTLALDNPDVVIVTGILVTDEDYYWELRHWDESVHYLSCVGSPLFLRQKLDSKEYAQLLHRWLLQPAHSQFLDRK